MTEQELIQKIKELKNIQPSQEWLDLTRRNLIHQTSLRTKEPQIGLFNWLKPLQPIALAICLVLILIGGPWLLVKASQASLPGEALYPIKKMTENLQTQTASEETKAQLQVEFANRRLEELNKITEDPFSPEEKVEQVVSDFKNNLAGASLHVQKIPKEKAVIVAEQTKKLKKNLSKTKEEAPLLVQDKLIEAEKIVEEINHQILAVLAGAAEGGETEEAMTTDKEVLIFLEEDDSGTMTTTDEMIK